MWDMEIRRNTYWGCIFILFAGQAIGSLGIARLFRMDLSAVAIPVLILSAGAIVSAIFRRVSEASKLGKWQWWVPVLIYALFIFSLSNRAYPGAQPIFSTKVFHPIEYLVLGVFISLALLPAIWERGLPAFSARLFLLGVLFAASDELHQAFIPGRTPALTDILFWDLMGISLAWAAILTGRRFLCASGPPE